MTPWELKEVLRRESHRKVKIFCAMEVTTVTAETTEIVSKILFFLFIVVQLQLSPISHYSTTVLPTLTSHIQSSPWPIVFAHGSFIHVP